MLTLCLPCPGSIRVLSWVRLLTISTLRLNSRDYIRDRSTTDNPENAINLSSIRIEASNDAYGSPTKSGQPGVSVTVHRSTTLNFGRSKSDHDVEPTFDISKPVRYLHLLATPILILSAGRKIFNKVKYRSRRVLARSWRNSDGTADWWQSLDTARYPCTAAWHPWGLLS
jgi:hypothetical protein